MRKGQPERMSKLQKTILWELQYDEAANVLNCFKCNYHNLKRKVAEKYGGDAIKGGQRFIAAGFSVAFHNSILNLYHKGLIDFSVKENKKGICQIAITELGEEVTPKCFNNKNSLKCFTNKKIYSLYPLEIAARTCEWSPTQLRRFKTISVFAPELLELFDVQWGEKKKITLKEALKIAEKRKFDYILNLLEKEKPTRTVNIDNVNSDGSIDPCAFDADFQAIQDKGARKRLDKGRKEQAKAGGEQ